MDEEKFNSPAEEVYGLAKQVRDIDAEITRLQSSRRVLSGNIKVQIVNGDLKSGDDITDFMIAHCDDFSRHAGSKLRDLSEAVKASAGKEIVMIRKYMQTALQKQMQIGILKRGMEVKIKEGIIVFPVDRFAYLHSHMTNWSLTADSSIRIRHSAIGDIRFCKGIEDKIVSEDSTVVYIGTQVADYFRTSSPGGVMDLRYIDALEIIGHPVPEDFAAKKAEVDLMHERQRVYNDIERVVPRCKNNVGDPELRQEAVGLFEKATELGMFSGDLTLFDWDGDRTNTRVPEYLRTQARELNISVPERKPEDAPAAESDMQLK